MDATEDREGLSMTGRDSFRPVYYGTRDDAKEFLT